MRTELRRHRFDRWLAVVAAMVLVGLTLFTVGGFFVAPLVLRPVAEHRLAQWLGREVAIERVRVNPFALSVTVEGLEVLEADGGAPFLSFRRLYVNAELVSVFRRALVVREIRLESPRVRIERRQAPADASTDAAVYNFSDIVTRLTRPAAPASGATGDAALPRFSLNNIRVVGGALVFDDRPLGGHHEIADFSLGVPFLSTLLVDVDTFVAPGMSGRVDGTPFGVSGRSKLFKHSIESVVAIRLDALDLTRYLDYTPVPLPAAVSSALLTLALDVSFSRPRDEAPRLSLTGRVLLDDVSLRERDGGTGPLLDLRQLGVQMASADITARRFVIDEVWFSGLDVHVRRLPSGRLNLQRLLPETAFGPAEKEEDTKTRFSVAEIRVEDSTVRFRDETVRPPFEAHVDDISVSVEHLSNAPGVEATIEAALRASPGGKLAGHGRISLNPPASTGTVTLDGLEPGRFAPYYEDEVAFEVAKGRLRMATSYELTDRRDHLALQLRDGFVEVEDLALRRPRARKELLRIPELSLRGVDADFDGRAVSIADVDAGSGRLRIARDERGIIDVATLFRRSQLRAADKPPDPAWAVSVARLDMEGWDVRFEDRALNPPAVMSLAPLSLHATSLSTTPGRRGNVDLRLRFNKRGRLTLAGAVSLDPPAVDLRLDARTVEIVPLQSYVRKLFELSVTSGLASFRARAQIDVPGDRAAHSQPPRLRVTGDADVADFGAIDAAKKQDLLRWRSFHAGGLALSTAPFTLAIRELALTDFDAQLIVFPDAHFNFKDALGKPLLMPEKLSIGQLKLGGGKVRFTDQLIRPSFSTELTELAASVKGLSSVAGTRAEVDIRGRLDRAGQLAIAGKINPLEKDLFVDMRGDVKDFDLLRASPYAATYLGYGIKQGKLSLAVEYHVGQRRLDAHNHVVVDQLTLGDKVRSPDAVNAPVKLAVALLKDGRGVIDVELPVAGSLDDPGFSVARALRNQLVSRVVEAATAPFSFIAKTYGTSDELATVTFPPGLARLDDKQRRKLETLAKALHERREIGFEIQGRTDPERDREGLRRDVFERKLKTQKRAELARAGAAVGDVDDVRFDPSERPRLLAAAYRAERFSRPRTVFGFAKSVPPEEMERLMLVDIKVENEDLRALARRRAAIVKEALGKLAPADAARLFLIGPRMDGGAAVDFKLKAD